MRHIAIMVMLGHASFGAAQPVRLADDTGYILATVDDKERRATDRKDVDVYWVKAQKIHVTQGGAGGALLHGPFTAYYPNGQLRTQGVFKHGLKHGEWRSWSEDGKLIEVQRWRSGVPVGRTQRVVPDREELKRERDERRSAKTKRKEDRRAERSATGREEKEKAEGGRRTGKTEQKVRRKDGRAKKDRVKSGNGTEKE